MNQDNLLINGTIMDPAGDSAFLQTGAISALPQVVGVFDGLGGEEFGETAAFIAVRRLPR